MADEAPIRIEKLLHVLDSLKAGIIIADREGIILWGNEYYSGLAKFDIRSYYGRNVREISARENVQLPGKMTLLDQSILKGGEEIQELVKYNTDDYVITTLTPIRDEAGEISFYLYLLTNYSATLRMQKELSLSHARSSALAEQLQDMQFRRCLKEDIVIQDREMRRIFRMGARLAMVTASVALSGESGVGKDVLAKFIHRSGSRAGHPFIHVNLGAIPKELFESQLFGYAPGAFTGALKEGKIGLIQLADKGTLFLDEIGELPLDIQAKLLQVVQDKAVRAIGSTELVPVDVRIISATNRDLAQMVQDGTFRLDLYYRLNVIELHIPALRDRKSDIPMLAALFLQKYNHKYGTDKELAPEVIDAFKSYRWPGNIRELKHLIESLVILSREPVITLEQLPRELHEGMGAEWRQKLPQNWEQAGLKEALADMERELIREAVERTASLTEAAAYLKVDLSTLSKKRKKYGI